MLGQCKDTLGCQPDISLAFAHEDTFKLTDDMMAEIAREYMQRMGIRNTHYIVCRYTDKEHQHLHIVADRSG